MIEHQLDGRDDAIPYHLCIELGGFAIDDDTAYGLAKRGFEDEPDRHGAHHLLEDVRDVFVILFETHPYQRIAHFEVVHRK